MDNTKVLLGYCPSCGDRYYKASVNDSSHRCVEPPLEVETNTTQTPALD